MTTPFRGSDAELTRAQLRSSRFRREVRDVYVLSSRPSGLVLRCQALQLAVPDGVVSHETAAALHRLPAPSVRDLVLTRPPGSAPVRRPGVRAHVRACSPAEVVVQHGIRLTSGPRTFLDLAPRLHAGDLVVLADAVARRDGLDALRCAVDGATGRRGIVAARAALALCDPGSGSPAETRCRLLLHAAGFPRLQHGVVVRDEHGQWLAEPDLADPELRVAVQYDGLVHFEGEERRWQADVDRDELTRAAGWQLVVLTGRDLRRRHLAVHKVREAYRRAIGVR